MFYLQGNSSSAGAGKISKQPISCVGQMRFVNVKTPFAGIFFIIIFVAHFSSVEETSF
jgi:hypothetical protein